MGQPKVDISPETIKGILEVLGLSQRALGRRWEVSCATVNGYALGRKNATGKVIQPTPELLKRIRKDDYLCTLTRQERAEALVKDLESTIEEKKKQLDVELIEAKADLAKWQLEVPTKFALI